MRSLLVVLLTVFLTACGSPSTALPNSHDSIETLARAVLKEIERRDLDALYALALNRQEFTDHVWPELPAARPERNLSVSYVWGDLSQKSNIMLRETLAAHGGRKYDLVSMRFLGETTRYPSYLVHRESELTVRDATGREHNIRFFGSVIEKNKRFKVFSYVVED
jgi:hypothetical protein